jgi:PAS domain S-box-containing protein
MKVRSSSSLKTDLGTKVIELLNLAHDTIMVRDLDGTIRFWNHGAEEMYGFSSQEAIGRTSHNLLQAVFPRPLAEIEMTLLETGRWEGEVTHLGQDGARLVVASRWALQTDQDGHPIGVMEINNDISERKRAEEHTRRLNRVYTVLSDINQTIVREKDPTAMLESACRIAVEKGKFRMAWIGMIDPVTQRLEPVASSGKVEGYLDRVKINLLDPETETEPVASCLRTGKHSTCDDIEHQLFRPWRSDALRQGFRSVAAFPLRCEGPVVGVLCLYASELAFFDDDEIQVLDEMAMDISYALEVNRHEEVRRKSEEHIWQLNRVYAVLSGINETIVREKDSQAMLESACRIAVEKGKFVMAWIGMTNPAMLQVDPIASSGDVDGYLNQITIDFNDPEAAGPTANCLRSGHHAICNDIENDSAYISIFS